MCQTKDLQRVENGAGEANIRPKTLDDTVPTKNGFYMDEAISKTKFGVFNYVIIFLGGLILFAVLVETTGTSFIFLVSQCDLNLTVGEKGILGAVSFIGIICSSHLMGYLSDTKGRRKVILPTLFIAFLLSIASSLVHNFYLLATLRFLNGFFISGASATIYAYLGEFHNSLHRSRAIMASTVIYGISCPLLPVIAGLVINHDWKFYIPLIGITYKPWRLYLVVCGLPGFLAALITLFLPESPKFVLGQGDSASAWKILQKMNRWNNGRKSKLEQFEIYEEEESIENRRRILKAKESRFPLLKSIWNQTAPLFKPPHLYSTLLICTIQFAIGIICFGFGMFFADILNKMATNMDSLNQRIPMCDLINKKPLNMSAFNQNETICNDVCITKIKLETLENGIILEVFFAIGCAIISLIINKVGKFPILLIISIVCGGCGIMCMLTNILFVQTYSFVLLMCAGWGMNVINAATVEIYPTALRAMAICISLMFGRLGGVFGANIMAHFIGSHCEMVFYLSGSSMIAVGLFAFFIPHIHERVKKVDS
ncbi:synaptic vesicle glycoprotein 2B-like isoform X1 [Contarinia nasturtii]|uniref:synaptic vesicle glycoprotein 2B-like isoform X1 n=1 Tax=Contarinia nasturtii TaxID=265458 RepID=UPI0012D4C212|nr:synaptic vesicle glycoprotein 2B-like isoform X1 [Contarinia nasturtii]